MTPIIKPKRKRLVEVSVLPSLFTIGNLLCGFGAITFTQKGNFVFAAWLILLGLVVFDGLDGLVARATKSVTRFGAQLDSLADVVTFGVAPAFLAYQLIHQNNSHLISPKFTFLICAFYLACAALRLARFNVEQAPETEDHNYFNGLPSPGAAGLVASIIIFNKELMEKGDHRTLTLILPGMTLLLAILMISRLHYIHFLNRIIHSKHPFIRLVEIVLIVMLVAHSPEATLFFAFLFYILSAPLTAAYTKLFVRHNSDTTQ
jgi:CDP-diacylglycerol--serine O-phosphatidyltransferase